MQKHPRPIHSVCVCVCVCVRACVRARARVYVCVRACVRVSDPQDYYCCRKPTLEGICFNINFIYLVSLLKQQLCAPLIVPKWRAMAGSEEGVAARRVTAARIQATLCSHRAPTPPIRAAGP